MTGTLASRRCLVLDGFHIVVRKAEMMADLMNEDVRHQMAELVVAISPFIKDRATVQEHHIRLALHIRHTLFVEANALIEPCQIKGVFDAELVEDIFGGKVFNAYNDITSQFAE